MEHLIVATSDEGLRLDQLLAKHYPSESRSRLARLIEEGYVLLNGEKPKKRALPQAGDRVEIEFVLPPECDLEAQDIPLDILYEDEHMLAINKRPGMVVHPGAGNWTGTFVNALLFHCKELPGDDLRPGIVHRLDKDTSGVLLAAKTEEARGKLMDAFANRQVKKSYLAIVVGNPGNVTIEAPISRSPHDRKKMSIVEGGKPATTVCEVVGTDGKLTLLRIDLKTGRTHQIRVHLQHHRTPVLGDSVYGNKSANQHYGAMRQMLHAESLSFVHPFSGKEMDIKAPLLEDMALCERLSNGLNEPL